MSNETDDRERGVLSVTDREYLDDPEGYAEERYPQSVHEREKAISQRLADSVLDLAYLDERLPSNLRAGVFAPDAPRAEELDGATTDALAFVYSAMREYWSHPTPDRVEDAIRRVEERTAPSDYIVDVDVSIKPRPAGTLAREGAEKIDAGERVSDAEVRAMLQEKIIDPDDVAAYLRGESVDLPAWRREGGE